MVGLFKKRRRLRVPAGDGKIRIFAWEVLNCFDLDMLNKKIISRDDNECRHFKPWLSLSGFIADEKTIRISFTISIMNQPLVYFYTYSERDVVWSVY